MAAYGSITIDNQNLLNDLLGLEGNDNQELPLYQPRQINSQFLKPPNINNAQSNYLPVQGRKTLLESPTFSKKEDDIYRYVHSRISSVDNSLNAGHNYQDSLDHQDENVFKRNHFVDNNQQIDEYPSETNRRIGSNKLLSDLAVASVSKRDNIQINRINNQEEPIYENELVDSLDINSRHQNNQQNYFSNRPKLTQPLAQPISQPLIENQYILQQQHQQIQQQQQFQQQQYLPFQGQQLIVLQSPTSQPIVNSSLQLNPQAQFIPITLQPQLIPGQNMFYQEPVQPLFYNTAYPMIQNQNFQNPNFQNQNFYNQEEYAQNSFQQQPYQLLENRNFPNGLQSVTGIRYDAQPLQPPVPPPRNNKTLSQQSNDSYELNSPDSDEEINNDFNQLKVNNQEPKQERSDSRAQEYWVKLQKARESRDKNSGLKKKIGSSNTLPSVSSNRGLTKKPPLPDKNYLEKNIESIRNKENLIHRYPEKKYEVVHGKNVNERLKNIQGSPKKPPQHLNPLDNIENEDDLNNYNANKRISIPISPSKYKDQDHINVDINLRLVDFLPNQGENRSFDDFDVQNDPLARYIRKFENNISRSLPGSSGSLNKLKPLPPLSRKLQKPFSHEGGRLQHEYDNEIKNEEGYLAQLQKANQKAPIKTYTLKDYRNYKKDTLLNVANHTGKLGFDYESDAYKQKLESSLRKNDYAERVKIRNQIIIAEQKKAEEGSTRSQPVQEPSKTQRAKEYVEKNVIRIKSASKTPDSMGKKVTKSAPNDRPEVSQPRQTRNMPKRLDLSKQKRPEDTAIVKIRDPVTSKLRTIFLNDEQIEELSKRHQAEKELVDNTIVNKKYVPVSPAKTEKPRQPIDLKETKYFIQEIVEEGRSSSPIEQKPIAKNTEDDKLEQLLQRHNQEKSLVNQYETGPYPSENFQTNQNSNQISIEV